jgi:hypothetical protein
MEDVEDSFHLIDKGVDSSAEGFMMFDPKAAVHFVTHDLILSKLPHMACGKASRRANKGLYLIHKRAL